MLRFARIDGGRKTSMLSFAKDAMTHFADLTVPRWLLTFAVRETFRET